MQLARKFLSILIALAMLVLGAFFAVQNQTAVPLDLLVISFAERSVALWVLLAFAVGGVLGLLTSLGIILRLRTQLLTARRKLSRHGETIEAPATAPDEVAENG
jgi:uncharacterized membrane protein YciS (DUF1049 family)